MSIKTKIEAQLIYWEDRDFGYQYLFQTVNNNDDISLESLEEAIYDHLISYPQWSSLTIICLNEAKKAANRVFERHSLSAFSNI